MTLHHWMTRSRWVAGVALALLLAACGASAEPPLPTRTPAPTFTPTSEVAQAPVEAPPAAQEQPTPTQEVQTEGPPPTPAPAQEVAATATPTLAAAAAEVVINSNINVRGGPGTNYNLIGAANQGQRYPVTGKSPDGAWWQINYNGQPGWVFGELVTPQNTQAVAVAANIPAAPPPTATPIPQPTQPPAPAQPTPAPEQPTAAPAPPANDSFPYILGETAQCSPNAGNTYFEGFVRDSNNNLLNGVCVHIAFYGPRGTKCSGCDGVGDGKWGFSPFGGPAPAGTAVEIFVVPCEGAMPMGGQTEQSGFGNLTQQSPKWTRTLSSSEQCNGITFYRR